jgi:hypothetical protein
MGPPGIAEEIDYEPILIPGPQGAAGVAGAVGAAGPIGPPGMTGEDAEEPIVIPGPRGADGSAGAGGSGALVLLESHTANNTSGSLNFTTRNAAGQSGATFQSDYDEYLLELVNLIPATNGTSISFRASVDGGINYDPSAIYEGQYQYFYISSAASGGHPGTTGPIVGGAISNVTADGGLCATYRFFSPLSTASHKWMHGTGVYVDSNAGVPLRLEVMSRYKSTTAVNAFQLFTGSGNLVSGVARLYGIAK